MSLRLQVVQQVLAPYRVPLFNRVADVDDIEMQISFCEDWTDGDFHTTLTATPNIISSKKWGPLRSLNIDTQETDVLVLPLNLKLTNTFWSFKSPKRRPAICYWGHGYGKLKLLNPLTTRLARRADAILSYAAANKQRMVDCGVAADKIFVCNNTLDIANHGWNQSAEKTDFLYVGRLQERKRIDELMLAFQTLSRNHEAIRLTIVGDGDIRKQLERQATDLKIDGKVEFTGKIFDNEILQTYFDKAIAYVSPGPVGLGVVHSFAFGAPVVTDATIVHGPESNYLRHQENSLLFDHSVDALTEAMQSLLNVETQVQLSRQAYDTFLNECDIRHSAAAFVDAVRYAAAKHA